MLRVLRDSLSGQAELRIVGEAGTLDRALTLVGRLRPDVVVMDAEIPGLDAASAIRALRQQTPQSAVVVISIEPDRLGPERLANRRSHKRRLGDRIWPPPALEQ